MSLPTSRLAYLDIFEILEKAIESPKGLRLSFTSRNHANHYRMRVNQARAIDRLSNESTFKEGDPLYGCSVYDSLTTALVEISGVWWLYLHPSIGPKLIEEIPSNETT